MRSRMLVMALVLSVLVMLVFATPAMAQEPTVAYEEGLFVALLIRLLNGGAAGIFVFWILEQPVATAFVEWLERAAHLFTFTASEMTRYVAIGLSTAISLGIYMLLVLVGVSPIPAGWVAWVDLILWLGALSFGASQVVHARKRL